MISTNLALLDEDDVVSRHIFRDFIRKDKNRSEGYRVTPNAFEPKLSNPDMQGLRSVEGMGVSVTCHRGLSDVEIRACGDEAYQERSDRDQSGVANHGRAELIVSLIKDKASPLNVAFTPGGRNHADIINWPEPVKDKAEHLLLRQELAGQSYVIKYE